MTVTASSEFVLVSDGSDAKCATCGKQAAVLVIEREEDGALYGPVYCWIHFAVVAGRATGIA